MNKLKSGTPGVIPPVTLQQGNPALGQETITLAPTNTAAGVDEGLKSVPTYVVAPADATSPAFDGAVVVAADGLSAKVQATGAATGNYTVTVTAEADPTPGVNTLTATQALTISPLAPPLEDDSLNASTSGAETIG